MRPLVGWLALGAGLTGAVALVFNSYRVQPQIFLGSLVPEGMYLQTVGLTYGGQRQPLCTGALIGARLVLTAAHCLCRGAPTHVFVGNDPRVGSAGRSEFYPVERTKSAAPCNEDPAGR